jgi:hypothetical protein
MDSKENEKILKFALLIILMAGIGAILYSLLKTFVKTIKAYNCPKCNYDKVLWGENCKICKQQIEWPAPTYEEYYAANTPRNLTS